jgi:hypothetical protein
MVHVLHVVPVVPSLYGIQYLAHTFANFKDIMA